MGNTHSKQSPSTSTQGYISMTTVPMTTKIIFAPSGQWLTHAISDHNHLTICTDHLNIPRAPLRHKISQIEQLIKETHGEAILRTHHVWIIDCTKHEWEEGFLKGVYINGEKTCFSNPSDYDSVPQPETVDDEDDFMDEWRREQAMQAGMAMGVNAYNDYMGYDLEEY
jgi:hypothetical protein